MSFQSLFGLSAPAGGQGANVRVEGLEPPCLAAPDPKSGTSTNFATPASFYKKSVVQSSEFLAPHYQLLTPSKGLQI